MLQIKVKDAKYSCAVLYESLGFTLTTEFAKFADAGDMVYPITQEFWLFDMFLICGWIS